MVLQNSRVLLSNHTLLKRLVEEYEDAKISPDISKMIDTPTNTNTDFAVENVAVTLPTVNTNSAIDNLIQQNLRPSKGCPRKKPAADILIVLQNNLPVSELAISNTFFLKSRQKKINELLDNGVFKVVPISKVSQGTKIFNSRFMDQIKNAGTAIVFKKSKLIVQTYNNNGKLSILTQAPTI